MKLGTRSHSVNVDEENPYWISFSDIMAGLLVIFIMASLALILELIQVQEKLKQTQVDVMEAIKEIAKAEQVRRDILYEIKEDLLQKNILVEVSDNDSVLRIPDEQLSFRTNEYTIPPDKSSQRIVAEIGNALHRAITKKNRFKYLDTVFVEGHTDSRRSPRHMGNWGLSTFRAISIWNFWNEHLDQKPPLASLKNHDGKPLFSVSGYAETRPVNLTESTEAELRQNRRIDIRFTVKRPSIHQYEQVNAMITE
jgi:flagellar motor protein MotB